MNYDYQITINDTIYLIPSGDKPIKIVNPYNPCPFAIECTRDIYCTHSELSYSDLKMDYHCSDIGCEDCKIEIFKRRNKMKVETFEERLQAFNEMIADSKSIVFFGGAGVSTESGIPDFRSKDGLYNQKDIQFEKYEPEYLLSARCLKYEPKVFYEFYRQKLDCRNIEPNVAHKVLADMENKGKLSAVITQNIDGLHQKAGSKRVYEIHGTTEINYCEGCKMEYHKDFIFNCTQEIPRCECGEKIRPDVTLYDEQLPANAWYEASRSLRNADLLIVAGTSLTVFPAVHLIQDYYGKNLVIINRDETDYDKYADIVFRENVGDVLKKIKY